MKKGTILSVTVAAVLLSCTVLADVAKTKQSIKLALPEKGANAATLANTMPMQNVAPLTAPCRVDGRVKAALDAVGIKYDILDSGVFRVIWIIGDGGRTHTAFIGSQTEDFDGIELREIWACGFESDSIDKNNLHALLELNATYPIGAWQVVKLNNGRYRAFFGIKVSANASGEVLLKLSNLAASKADDIEAKATKEDKM